MSQSAYVYLSIQTKEAFLATKTKSLMGRRVVTRSEAFPMNHCLLLVHPRPHPGIQNKIPGLGLRQQKKEPAAKFGNEKLSKPVRHWAKTIGAGSFIHQSDSLSSERLMKLDFLIYCLIRFLVRNWALNPGRQGERRTDILSPNKARLQL